MFHTLHKAHHLSRHSPCLTVSGIKRFHCKTSLERIQVTVSYPRTYIEVILNLKWKQSFCEVHSALSLVLVPSVSLILQVY